MAEITNPHVENYIRGLLARHDDPVLDEMERRGHEQSFPIIDRMAGVVLELTARSIGARRIFELGSGFGYSAYWFARATGPARELHLTDRDPGNRDLAVEYLGRAGLASGVTFHVGDALDSFASVPGEFDIVFCDIDKSSYPRAWAAARERIRPGGLYIVDNTLMPNNVAGIPGVEIRDQAARQAVVEHNAAIVDDPEFLATILPIREGVLVARRSG